MSCLPQFPLPSAAAADGEVGEPVLRIGEPAPAGEFSPENNQPKVQTFGGDHPLKVCTFGSLPSLSIGELADAGPGWPQIFNRPPIARIGSD